MRNLLFEWYRVTYWVETNLISYFGDRYWSDCRFAIFGEGWEKGGEEEGRQGSVTRMNSGRFTNEVGQWCLVVESAVFLDV